jgi:ABC-type sugar transport system permease subunit
MNDDFRVALINNARWLVVFITVPTTLGLGLALVFNNDMAVAAGTRSAFTAPLVLSYPVIGLVWSWIYNPRLGLLNSLRGSRGGIDPPGGSRTRSWRSGASSSRQVWRQVGYVMVLYLAGLKNIDPTLVEAAIVDGADRWNLFRRVIFPLLAPVTTIIIVISIIDSLRAFDLVQIMTRGNTGTEVLANMMYMEAFNNYAWATGPRLRWFCLPSAWCSSASTSPALCATNWNTRGPTMTTATMDHQDARQVTGQTPGQQFVANLLRYGILTFITLLWLLPVFAALLTSFRTMDDISTNGFWSVPQELLVTNFSQAWTDARVSNYLLNSFIITIPSLFGMLFLSSLSSYALARFKFKGNLFVYFMYVAGTMLPFQILLLPVFRLTNEIWAV